MNEDEETTWLNKRICTECWDACGVYIPMPADWVMNINSSPAVPNGPWLSDCHHVPAEPRWWVENGCSDVFPEGIGIGGVPVRTGV